MTAQTPPSISALYEEDFVLWTEKTAELLKRKEFDRVDWENLIEEVEGMGKSDRRAVESLLTQLLIHLLKLSYCWESERERNARHWIEEIANFRVQLEEWTETTTLANHARDYLKKAYSKARKTLIQGKIVPGNLIPAEPPFSLEQVLDGDWFPIDIEPFLETRP